MRRTDAKLKRPIEYDSRMVDVHQSLNLPGSSLNKPLKQHHLLLLGSSSHMRGHLNVGHAGELLLDVFVESALSEGRTMLVNATEIRSTRSRRVRTLSLQ